MKFTIAAILFLTVSVFSQTRKMAKTEPGYTVDPTFIRLNESDKGTLFLDPKNCRTVMVRDNLEISLVKTALPDGTDAENFQIKFPDGDTAIGNIYKARKNLPACFHSLTITSTGYRVQPIGYGLEGMENCKKRTENELFSITHELKYSPDKKFQEDKKNTGDGFINAHYVKIERGTGLTFYVGFNKQAGSNLTTQDLKPKNDSYLDKCETGAPNKAPLTPATTRQRKTI